MKENRKKPRTFFSVYTVTGILFLLLNLLLYILLQEHNFILFMLGLLLLVYGIRKSGNT